MAIESAAFALTIANFLAHMATIAVEEAGLQDRHVYDDSPEDVYEEDVFMFILNAFQDQCEADGVAFDNLLRKQIIAAVEGALGVMSFGWYTGDMASKVPQYVDDLLEHEGDAEADSTPAAGVHEDAVERVTWYYVTDDSVGGESSGEVAVEPGKDPLRALDASFGSGAAMTVRESWESDSLQVFVGVWGDRDYTVLTVLTTDVAAATKAAQVWRAAGNQRLGAKEGDDSTEYDWYDLDTMLAAAKILFPRVKAPPDATAEAIAFGIRETVTDTVGGGGGEWIITVDGHDFYVGLKDIAAGGDHVVAVTTPDGAEIAKYRVKITAEKIS